MPSTDAPPSHRSVIPSSVTRIGDYAFLECSSLTSVAILSSMTRFGFDAFPASTDIRVGAYPIVAGHVTVPEGVTEIGDCAFRERHCHHHVGRHPIVGDDDRRACLPRLSRPHFG